MITCNLLNAAAVDYQLFYGAIARGDIDAVQHFLEENRDIDINYRGDDYNTPLHKACKHGNMNLVSLFLDFGADIEAKSKTGSTPLFHAALNDHREAVELLLQRGANVNATNKHGTSLHIAVMRENVVLIKLLLQHGVNLEIKDSAGMTAAEIARAENCPEIEELISSWHANEALLDIKDPGIE